MYKPRVKPLEWEDFGDRAAKANAMLLTNYLIDQWSDGRFEVTVSSPGYGTGFDGKRWHNSMSEAKDAAQADYEARILAALEPVTVQEAALVLLDAMPEVTAKPLAEMSDAMKIEAHPSILLRGFCAALRAIAEAED